MTREELRYDFHNEQGISWENSQGEPDIDYVIWLEDKILTIKNYPLLPDDCLVKKPTSPPDWLIRDVKNWLSKDDINEAIRLYKLKKMDGVRYIMFIVRDYTRKSYTWTKIFFEYYGNL